MECPECKTTNPAKSKFCTECSNPLAKLCANCGTANQPSAKFCLECRRDLRTPTNMDTPKSEASIPKPETIRTPTKEARFFTKRDELRLVTILFSDIKGFTSLSERLDPDEIKEIMNDCFMLLKKQIEDKGGIVAKYIGDSIMALFGVPISHEDDAARAIRAAMAMQEKLKNFSEKIKNKIGILLQMRVGINTGKVLAGQVGGKEELDVMGDAVNIAKRLEGLAPLGGILVSRETWKHTKNLFTFRSIGELEVKGKEQKVDGYEVLAEKADEQTLVGEQAGLKSPLIGRRREMSLLKNLLNQIKDEKYPRIITIFGPHGIGKSRLIWEFIKNCGEKTIYTRCLENAMLAYSAIKGLVMRLANISSEDTNDQALAKVNEILSDSTQSTIVVRLLGMAKEQKHDDLPEHVVLKALADYITKTAQKHPLILFVDDLHFADEGSIAAITYLAMAIENAPVYILCAACHEQFQFKEKFCQNLPNYQEITLQPLEKEDSLEMLKNLVPNIEIPKEIINLVNEQSGGNPFYIEEIIRDLMERNIITKSFSGKFEISSSAADIRVPSTLQGIIQARLDRLEINERILLQEAGVQGKEFWEEPVHIIENMSDQSLFDGIPQPVPVRIKSLIHKDFFGLRTTSRIPKCSEFTFVHGFTHDVIYDSIPGKQKRLYHSIIADWLSKNIDRNPQALYGLIGFHYEKAGNTEKAAESYIKVAEFSRQSYDLTNAIKLYKAALPFLVEEKLERTSKVLAELLVSTGSFDEAIDVLEKAQTKDIETFILLAQAEDGKGNYEKAFELYDRAQSEAEKTLTSNKSIHMVKISNGLTNIYMRKGENDKAIEKATQVLSALENLSPSVFPEVEPLIARSHLLAGNAMRKKGLYAQANNHYKMAHSLYQALMDYTGVGKVLNNIGILNFHEGNLSSAERYYKQALEVAEKTGNLRERVIILINIGLVSREKYQFENAIKVLTDSLRLYQRMGDKWGMATSLINLALTHIDIGNSNNALLTIEKATEMGLDSADSDWQWFKNFIFASCKIMEQKPLDSYVHIHNCIDLAKQMKSNTQTAWSILLMAEARVEANEFDSAYQTLTKLDSYSLDPKDELKKLLLLARTSIAKGDTAKAREILEPIESKISLYKDMQIRYYLLLFKITPDNGNQKVYLNKAVEAIDSVASMFNDDELRNSFFARPDIKEVMSLINSFSI